MTAADKARVTQEGLEAIEQALELEPDHVEALVYSGLLRRLQASMVQDAAEQDRLLGRANADHTRALEIRSRQRASGAG